MEDATTEPTRRQWVGFWCMIVQQTQNAFNDKMSQFILIPLGAAVGFSVESQAGMLIALPFVLFAPVAGWLSDRFSKRDVMLGSAVVQLALLAGICGAVMARQMGLAMVGFFGLAIQSAFFSPAKIGINKELVGSRHLGFAAAIQQMTAMLAILAGQVAAGWWFDHRYHELGGVPAQAWPAALWPLVVLAALAVPAIALAAAVPRVPAQGHQPFRVSLLWRHFGNLGDLWRDEGIRQASFGVAFFWGFAAYINLWSVKVAKALTGGGEGFGTMSSKFMAAASLGMAAGFGCASYLLRRHIELGWVPLAGILMTGFSLALHQVAPDSQWFLIGLGMLAFSSALFLAPLHAWLQDHYPHDMRGDLQAAVNLQDCLAGVLAISLIVGFEMSADSFGLTELPGLRMHLLFLAAACLLATGMILRLLPADFIRVIGSGLVRAIYKVRSTGLDHIPRKGGALLLPNHVTFADSFLLSAACPRPIRFVMDEAFTKHAGVRLFTALFDTVTIRRDQPLEAIREVIRALGKGDCVCLFPEGQLTRTGTLCPLQRGFELIARKTAGFPLIPVWCDGSWGSIFSFERNSYFHKRPRKFRHGVQVAFGNPLATTSPDIRMLQDALLRVSASAVAHTFRGRRWDSRMPTTHHVAAQDFRELAAADRRRIWVNGHQVGMVNALPRCGEIHALASDPMLALVPAIFVTFPELFRTHLRIHETFDGERAGVWIGGDRLRQALQTTQITREVTFFDFGSRPLKPVERAGLTHCPCLMIDGIVIAMSMPHPPVSKDDFDPQPGRKPKSWGRLLPGFWIERPGDGPAAVHGPSARAYGLRLPGGTTLDDEGFLVAP